MLLLVSCTQQMDTDNEVIICPIEQQPEFPGGTEELKKYVKENSNWKKGQEAVQGNVFVGFVVKSSGEITDIRIVKGLCESCDREALRLVSEMPKWIPAQENGKPMDFSMIIPIKFKLSDEHDR